MRRRPGRFVAGFFVCLLLLGFLYETVSEAVDLRRYPPPGALIEMEGYALHLYCMGEGSPTVLLEAGLGGGVVTWPLVQPAVASSTRVCSYDRTGWAWSTGTAGQSGRETVSRLHSLLEKAGVKGPYILVGHSLGGLYNQLFAAAYPDEVAGLVLVEARHQEYARRLPTADQGGAMRRLVGPIVTRLGIVRLLGVAGALPESARRLPPGMMEMAIRHSSQRSAALERDRLPAIEDEVGSAGIDLGKKPVIVITRDPAVGPGPASDVWHETQRLYLSLSSQSRLVEARGAGHMVPYEAPEVVTEAIAEMLRLARP